MTRTATRVAVSICGAVAVAIGLTFVMSADHPSPRPTPWTDARVAAALTQASLGDVVRPADIAGILARDCPYLPDPAGLVQHQHAGTEAEANAVMSVLAQSGRC
jgi:hypothetical protein